MTPQPRPQLVLGQKHHDLHRATCRTVRHHPAGYDTRFTDDTSNQVALAVTAHDLRPCRICKPIRALTWWEHVQRMNTPIPTRTADDLAHRIDAHRFAALNETTLQEALAALLGGRREVTLTAGGRVDLLVGDVAVEVKVAGSAEAVYRQVQGYAKSAEVRELLIVTTRTAHLHLPATAGGKPLRTTLAKGAL